MSDTGAVAMTPQMLAGAQFDKLKRYAQWQCPVMLRIFGLVNLVVFTFFICVLIIEH